MFEFTIRENDFLNGFLDLLSDYVNKSYKFTMSYLTSPLLSDVRESERLVLLVVNKSVFQNMYSFIKLNDSNMQFASFSCLETAVNSMRLYYVLATNPDYMHEYITGGNFSLEVCENEISEKQKEYIDYYYNEDLSLAEIAQNDGITRQGVRDIIKKGEKKLFEYEEKLLFMKKTMNQEKQIENILAQLNKIHEDSSDEKVNNILEEVKKELNCLV